MCNEMRLIIPVLPGKSEAWRRFLQELEGSRGSEFAHWCQTLGMEIKSLKLYDSLGCALILLTVEAQTSTEIVEILAHQESPFNHWLLSQIQNLHGLDLTRLQLKQKEN